MSARQHFPDAPPLWVTLTVPSGGIALQSTVEQPLFAQALVLMKKFLYSFFILSHDKRFAL